MMKHFDLSSKVLASEDKAILFLQRHGIFNASSWLARGKEEVLAMEECV